MKKQKQTKILSVATFFVISLLFTTKAHAVMRANFPNANSLQPIPQGISANVSQNVNATSTYNPNDQAFVDYSNSLLDETPGPATTTGQSRANSANKNTSPNVWYWSFILIIIVAGILWWSF